MKNIEISLVKKYVNGEDLGEHKLEDLENDVDFMKTVISYTNDYKIYSLCSDNLKRDYSLVKYLVLKFKNNIDFIMNVADYFIDNVDSDLEVRELSIIMDKILPKNKSQKYKELNAALYISKRLEIELIEMKNPKLENQLGMGFFIIFDDYNMSETIIDYYADCLLKEIIIYNNIDFEKMLHSQFKTSDELLNIGVNNYVIGLIKGYDSMLSSYISAHIYLIEDLVNDIKEIQSRWDDYILCDEAKRYENMLEMVNEYMSDSTSTISENEILYYVAKELGVKDKVIKYDFLSEEDIEIDEETNDDMIKHVISHSLKEKKVYLDVKKIMVNQLFSNKPLDLYSLIPEESKNKKKQKMIKFNPDLKNNK